MAVGFLAAIGRGYRSGQSFLDGRIMLNGVHICDSDLPRRLAAVHLVSIPCRNTSLCITVNRKMISPGRRIGVVSSARKSGW